MRTSRMAERALFGESRGGSSEEGCVVPLGVELLSSGVQGNRAGEGKTLNHRRWSAVSGLHAICRNPSFYSGNFFF